MRSRERLIQLESKYPEYYRAAWECYWEHIHDVLREPCPEGRSPKVLQTFMKFSPFQKYPIVAKYKILKLHDAVLDLNDLYGHLERPPKPNYSKREIII